MKKIILSISAILFSTGSIFAQTASVDLDINNVRAKMLTAGDMFFNPTSQNAAYEFPKNSGKNSMYAAGLWVAGKDATSGLLKVAAQTYRQEGTDFWAGPLTANSIIDTVTSQKWDRFWKVNKTDIDLFLTITQHTGPNTPLSILEWPAKGNPFTVDANGTSLPITQNMAPFMDANNDGNYNALEGDYPAIKGDQAIWWVFNDQKTHYATGGNPLNIEVKMMAFACSTNDALNNTTFYDYEIKNFSTSGLDSVRIGFWNDVDLGFGFDDFAGFDSSRRMAIAYNGDSLDDGTNGYGLNLTQTGIIILKTPNDNGITKVPLGSFMTYDNSFTSYGNPEIPEDYRRYLNASWLNGQHLTNGCNVTPPQLINYIFTDQPNLIGGFSERQCGSTPSDRRSIISTQDFSFAVGAPAVKYEVAIVNTPPGSSNVDFSVLKTMADLVIAHPDGCYAMPANVSNLSLFNDINVYPNPTSTTISIDWKNGGVKEISWLNMLGKTIETKLISNEKQTSFDVKKLNDGIYFIQVKTATEIATKRFVKN